MTKEACLSVNAHGQQICPLPVWSRSDKGLCLFHDPKMDKPEEEFLGLLHAKLQAGDFNFEGYVFTPSVLFRDFVFQEFANFENCQFLGKETSFYRARFKKGVLFNQAVFRGSRVNFSKAQLSGDFNLFNGVLFESAETIFQETQFGGKHIGFASARFSGQRLDFKDAEFLGTVFFTQCHFHSHLTTFEKAKLTGPLLSFTHAEFKGRELRCHESLWSSHQADFSHASFETDLCHFDRAHFQGGKLLFSDVTFKCRTLSFLQAKVQSRVFLFSHSFVNCHETDLSELCLAGDTAEISSCTFQGKSLKLYPVILECRLTDFSRSEFAGDEKIIYIENPQQNDLSFLGVLFHGGKTKLKGDLHAASFIDTSLDNVDLHEGRWSRVGGRFVCRDEIDANRVKTPAHYLKAEEVCRNIKRCYEGYGDYEIAADFYYGEMECKRKESRKKRWGALQLMRLTSGYGMSPIRVTLTSLFIIFLFAIFYLFGGIETPHGVLARTLQIDFTQVLSTLNDFFSCFYFSVSMFLGFGDYRPIGWSRVVGGTEAFFGAFFISMFVLSIGKKMNW